MDLDIRGKTALVTGGSKGIGYAVASGLAAEGVRVFIAARNEARLAEAVTELRADSGEAAGFAADVSKADEIETLLEHCRMRFGAPDILIANAGGPPAGKASKLTEADWAKGYDLTLMANVRLAKAVLPAMQANGWGRIINVTSLSIKQPVANLTLSNAYRAAVTGFAKTLSTEVAASGVTVNNVGPGYTATKRLQELFDKTTENALVEGIPAKRLGTPAEVAAAAVFLASQQAAYITGQTIIVDGGVVGASY